MIESGALIDGKYDVMSRVGGGTSGDVYKARIRKTGCIVAIKAQRSRTLHSTTHFRSLGENLAGEMNHMKRLHGIHGVPTVHADGEHEGRRYFVMDYIDGVSLLHLVDSIRPVHLGFAATVLAQLCAIVEQIHDRGLLHCDIKPDNVAIRQDGSVWLLDYGSALDIDDSDPRVYPTPGYTPPEYFTDAPPTTEWDIYALGATLFEMCALFVPYAKHEGRPTRDTPQFPGIPLENIDDTLRELGLRMVAFDADRRPDIAEIQAVLEPMLPRPGDRRDPRTPYPDPAEWYRYGRHLKHRAS